MECARRAGIDFALAGWVASKELNAPLSFTAPHEVLKWLNENGVASQIQNHRR